MQSIKIFIKFKNLMSSYIFTYIKEKKKNQNCHNLVKLIVHFIILMVENQNNYLGIIKGKKYFFWVTIENLDGVHLVN